MLPFLGIDINDPGNSVADFLSWLDEQGGPEWLPYVVSGLIGILSILLWAILSQLAFVWIERRLIGRIQVRMGPNRVGPFGLLQPLADALKVLTKEMITPTRADKFLYWAAPIAVTVPALLVFAVLPFGEHMVLADLNVGVLFVIAVSSVNTVIVFAAGWASSNKYSLLGAMRTVAMLISYELIQVLALLSAVLFVNSMRMGAIVGWQDFYNTWLIFLQPLALLAYTISGAVEINRTPTDIAEAESEIVAGYHTEYGGIRWGMFQLAEYIAGFAIAATAVTVYLGGWTLWGLEDTVPGWLIFLAKLYLFFFLFIWLRGTLPRLRIDQLMAFAWKYMLPLMLLNVLVVGLELLIWQENDLPAAPTLASFAIINTLLAGAMLVGWARALGHTQPERRPRRALLVQEIGTVHYQPFGGPQPPRAGEA
ncbi:MAG TPA: NADH-quinone oxidoreductase subunit NuoH [Dehalococcoidia bacterium]|nr:NADH-quinone oxidoreductase subunit NuoH [Dehalococcoidia bacterium]